MVEAALNERNFRDRNSGLIEDSSIYIRPRFGIQYTTKQKRGINSSSLVKRSHALGLWNVLYYLKFIAQGDVSLLEWIVLVFLISPSYFIVKWRTQRGVSYRFQLFFTFTIGTIRDVEKVAVPFERKKEAGLVFVYSYVLYILVCSYRLLPTVDCPLEISG